MEWFTFFHRVWVSLLDLSNDLLAFFSRGISFPSIAGITPAIDFTVFELCFGGGLLILLLVFIVVKILP